MSSFSGKTTLRSGKKSNITNEKFKTLKDALKNIVDFNPGDIENVISGAEIISLRL